MTVCQVAYAVVIAGGGGDVMRVALPGWVHVAGVACGPIHAARPPPLLPTPTHTKAAHSQRASHTHTHARPPPPPPTPH